MECRDAGIRIAIGDNENVADIIIVVHRRVDRHGQRHRVAVLGNLGQLDRDLALFGRLAAGEFGDLIRRLFGSGRSGPARTNEAERRAGSAERQGSATRQLPHRLILH